jgi:RHS repeat-associated protein
MQSGGTNYYFSYDSLGSVREVTDPNGNVISRYDYDPYGRLTVNEGIPPRLGFAGSYYHQPSGLSLTEYRAYDPNLGRWESRDPIEGGNSYAYGLNDPIDNIDPLGLDVTVCYYVAAAHDLGHVGYGVTGESGTQGFYPGNGPFSGLWGRGQIAPDTQPQKVCYTIPKSQNVDQCLQQCRSQRAANPGTYDVLFRQCTSFAHDCLQQCGVKTTYGGAFPYLFFENLVSDNPGGTMSTTP